MIKLTVLYNHPEDPAAFESYYAATHMSLVSTINGVLKAEVTKFLPEADGSKPAYYRMAELYFESPEALQQSMDSPEGQATAADLPNFATGGFKILAGMAG
ncbi:EthD family reductase [Algoriphagus antarcticus]|uniref:Uncharacterized protein (TIGR02118 family) n=1 Tax=Algoriphagus antarcticus TaxID=238540 RepID=A0A3E0DS54_9BACT|nr:EthD family reductase [Algoriphagus antarcticus]REG86352.1 uncharacterized protein (TIGR02118 family) [Algoriphagus antarcticus]